MKEANFLISPVGDVLTVKACDFCDGEKKDPIPYAEELEASAWGNGTAKELKMGFNGCGMACYGAVKEDIGIVFRKGTFDLFLGAKTGGRTAHPGQIVAEGIAPDQIVGLIERLLKNTNRKAYPNERFFKFFKRVKQVQGFTYQDITPNIKIEAPVCGD